MIKKAERGCRMKLNYIIFGLLLLLPMASAYSFSGDTSIILEGQHGKTICKNWTFWTDYPKVSITNYWNPLGVTEWKISNMKKSNSQMHVKFTYPKTLEFGSKSVVSEVCFMATKPGEYRGIIILNNYNPKPLRTGLNTIVQYGVWVKATIK